MNRLTETPGNIRAINQKIYNILQSLPNSFSETLRMHMNLRNVSISLLEADGDLSKNTIGNLRNNDDLTPDKLTVLKLCLGLHLEYEFSMDLFHKAGYLLNKTREDLAFDFILRYYSDYDIESNLRLLKQII